MRPPARFRPHPFSYHQEIELRVDTLTNQGQGLGRLDNWVVMVPFALPGERVRARVFRNHASYSEADLVEVIEASPDRVDPPCPLFGVCGGCQYQNLRYPAQLEWKRRQVAELLRHMGGFEFPVEPVVPSPREYGYRSKLTPHFDRPRDGRGIAVGFLRSGSRRVIVDVPRCPLATEDINATLPALRARVLADAARYRAGATLLLRQGIDGVATDPKARVRERVAGLELEFPAGEFFQNNPFILGALVDHVVAEAAACGARHLVDAYCGSGLFALAAARRFASVAGVEISENSVALAQANALRNDLRNCQFLAGDASRIFGGIAFAPEETALVLDPPRKGSDEAFLEQLFAFGPARVVYVSCNPATQMRDLTRFRAAGYELRRVRPFDLFPQTKHLECVMTLVRAGQACERSGP